MGWSSLLSTLAEDGLTQWREVFGSLRRHMEGQQQILAGVGVALLVLLVFIADVYLARWLLRRGSKGNASASRRS